MSTMSLWFESTQNRYFLVPKHTSLPCGELVLYSVDGEQQKIDANFISCFEVTEEVANKYLEAEVVQVIEQVQNNFYEFLLSETQKNTKAYSSSFILSSRQSINNLIDSLIRDYQEELDKSSEIENISLQKLISQVKQVIDASLSDDPNQREIALDQMYSLQIIFKSHGIDLGDIIEKFPANLHQLKSVYRKSKSTQQTLDTIQYLSKIIENIQSKNKQNIVDYLVSFIKNYQKEDERQKKAIREQEYTELAEKAIKESLSQHPMPSLKFEDLLP